MADNTFVLEYDKFFQGLAPAAYLNSLSELGNAGQSASMTDCDILDPSYVNQGPELADLTNGTQAGAVTELIQFILDKAVTADVTYGIGTSKLFKISSTAVASDATWPHAITNCTDGESVINMGGNLYYLFNKASGGDIGKYNLDATFDDDWGSTIPTGAAALKGAPHPSASKEDLIAFGNGRYLGIYTGGTNTLAPTKLDFEVGNEVADVIFSNNRWLIAVNSGVSGVNRNLSQVFSYDGAAIQSVLADEAGVGFQRIGFLYELNGVVFIAYQDLSSTGFKIGYLAGKQIKPLGSFTGSLPTFAQKSLFKHTILFLSSGKVWSAGAVMDELPFQISQLADGGYTTCGALAAPFGTPMIASTDGGSNFKLAKFSGYATSTKWYSLVIPLSGNGLGFIDSMTVSTAALGTNAQCDIQIQANQGATLGNVKEITGEDLSLHYFTGLGLGGIEDVSIYLNWANGDATEPCPIRKVILEGHFVEA